MAGLNETPSGNRTHISFFGLRNAGKSTLVNAIAGQEIAIVSDVAGTTTDPVSKAMEILPLGPCVLTDTAGLDDIGRLGEERVRRTLEILEKTDVAVWVENTGTVPAPLCTPHSALCTPHSALCTEKSGTVPVSPSSLHSALCTEKSGTVPVCGDEYFKKFDAACKARNVPVLIYRRGDNVENFKKLIAEVKLQDTPRPLISDLLERGDIIVCVCPIDESAPKGRLILPQQQVIREALDCGASALVCQVSELEGILKKLTGTVPVSPSALHSALCAEKTGTVPVSPSALNSALCAEKSGTVPVSPSALHSALCAEKSGTVPVRFVVTDSQAFREVSRIVPKNIPLTSFSIIFARAKGDLPAYFAGVDAMKHLKSGDKVLIAEGCTHHRQCNDIGTVKLPKAVERFAGCSLNFEFASGNSFPDDLSSYALVIQCGGCMLTRRAVQSRIKRCEAAGVPITNYGIALAASGGCLGDGKNLFV